MKQQDQIPFEPPAKLNYKKHFTRHQSTLDPIEGIWTEYVVGTLSEDGKVIKRKEIPKRAIWIIIKSKGEYRILNEYGEQNKFIASFKRTPKKNTYTFNVYYLESKDRVMAEATLVNGNRLEMAFDAPKGIFEENYKEFMGPNHSAGSDKQLTLHWQFNWLKSFPHD
ncbi:MAG: hypothetical protein ISR82_01680 [Candidatus Marinimicrobia bacterium]|nr:hypothetical protein [Candidatus Neomarinimicrobiota bacterium]